jgi:Bacterial regulatory proteins, tetR family
MAGEPVREGSVDGRLRRMRGGRPTLAEAAALTEVILDVAKSHFLQFGYQETTFDRIAHEVGTSKGAIYSRYPDKISLFSAVCEGLIVSLYKSDIVKLDTTMPIRACLVKQGTALLAAALNPTALKLYEMITHDAPRHPELSKSTLAVWGANDCLSSIPH